MKRKAAIILMILGNTLVAQNADIGIFDQSKVIGDTDSPVIADYDPETQIYLFNKRDQPSPSVEEDVMRYIYSELTGDFIITANFKVQEDEYQDFQVGFMVRESDDENSSQISAKILGDGAAAMVWRELEDNTNEPRTERKSAPKFDYETLQLERTGNIFTMRAAHFGEPLQEIGSLEKNLPDNIFLGLFCSADSNGADTLVKISNFRLDKPVPRIMIPVNQDTWAPDWRL